MLLPLSRVPTFQLLGDTIWEMLTNDQWVLQVVRGYKLELMAMPTQQSQPPTVVATDNQDLMAEEVQKLLDKGAAPPPPPLPRSVYQQDLLGPQERRLL